MCKWLLQFEIYKFYVRRERLGGNKMVMSIKRKIFKKITSNKFEYHLITKSSPRTYPSLWSANSVIMLCYWYIWKAETESVLTNLRLLLSLIENAIRLRRRSGWVWTFPLSLTALHISISISGTKQQWFNFSFEWTHSNLRTCVPPIRSMCTEWKKKFHSNVKCIWELLNYTLVYVTYMRHAAPFGWKWFQRYCEEREKKRPRRAIKYVDWQYWPINCDIFELWTNITLLEIRIFITWLRSRNFTAQSYPPSIYI